MKKNKIRLIAGALAAICLGMSSCTVVYESKDSSEQTTGIVTDASTEEPEAPKTPVELPTAEELAKVVATCGETEITAEEYYFFLYELAELIVAQNGDFLAYYGGELPEYEFSLKTQYIQQDMTWHDYLVKEMNGYIEYNYLVAEAAKKAGITLDEDELAEIEENAEKYTAPRGVTYLTKETARKCLPVSALASKYRKHIEDTNPKATADEIQAEYDKNTKLYTHVQLSYFPIAYLDGTETQGEETSSATVPTPTKQQAQECADKLTACTTAEEFKSVVKDFLKELDPDISEEDLQYQVESTHMKELEYQEGYDIVDWAFEKDRVDGETKAIWSEKDKVVFVGLLIKAPYRDETKTASVRHILVEKEDLAKQILAEFNDSDKTEESFAALAEKYTTDPGSATKGGLYENFAPGTMVTEFNDWSFDEKRAYGDVEIVKTSYGYHIMFYVSEGLSVCEAAVKTAVETARIDAVYAQMEKDLSLSLDEAFTKALDI